MITSLIVGELFFIINIVVVWFLFGRKIDNLQKRIDNIFTVDPATPNEATKKGSDLEPLGEQNMLNIPSSVKFEIEGQDNIPPGFSDKK